MRLSLKIPSLSTINMPKAVSAGKLGGKDRFRHDINSAEAKALWGSSQCRPDLSRMLRKEVDLNAAFSVCWESIMATTNFSAQGRVFSETAGSIPGPSWTTRALEGIKLGWRAYVRYERLSKMSDEALRQRGLTRDQIGREAFFGQSDL